MTVGSIVVVMILFALIVQLIGYYAVSASFGNEYSDFALRCARIGSEIVKADELNSYLNYSQDELQ